MSNGLTAVLLDVLSLAACRFATTDWEKRFAYFLIQHDASRVGLGTAGLEVSEFGWTHEDFENEKRFILAVVDAALAKSNWELLGFEPRPESILPALERLRAMIIAFPMSAIPRESEDAWIPDELPTHGECEVHHVYLHELGCMLCNDQPIDAPPNRAPHRT
ncbi:hypothetical protein [Labilithrix luteola]|nr:hypothetical protein [Labilithrix luteola]